MNTQRIVLLAVAVSTVVVVGCSKKSPERTAPVQLVSDLAVFATGEAPDEASLATTSQALASGSLTMERYVDGLLKQKMGARLAKDLVVSPSDTLKDRHPIAVHSVLKKSTVDGTTIYHLRGKCSASDAVSGRPRHAKGHSHGDSDLSFGVPCKPAADRTGSISESAACGLRTTGTVPTATSMTRLACLAPQGGRLRYMTLHVHLTLQDDFKGWWALRFRH